MAYHRSSESLELSAGYSSGLLYPSNDIAMDTTTVQRLQHYWHEQDSYQRNHTPSSYAFHLFAFPPEILDFIFEYAYQYDPRCALVWKSQWKMAERARQQMFPASYAPRPFPKLKVEEWMLSKHYFVLAATAWSTAQTFEGRSRFGCLDPWIQPKGVIGAFLQNAKVDLRGMSVTQIHWMMEGVKFWPGLRYLNFTVSRSAFKFLYHFRLMQEWREDEIDGVFECLGLEYLIPLRGAFMWVDIRGDFAWQEQLVFKSNIDRLMERVASTWSPATGPLDASEGETLYPGSKVRFGQTTEDLARDDLAQQLSKLVLDDPETTAIHFDYTDRYCPSIEEVRAALLKEGIDAERFYGMLRPRMGSKRAVADVERTLEMVAIKDVRTGLLFPRCEEMEMHEEIP